MKQHLALAAAAIILTPSVAVAQANTQQQSSTRDRVGALIGALFGDRLGATTSIEAQWAAGQTPLAKQRVQFESRIDTEVRSGALNQATATRLKADYVSLVQLETRYAADRRFTTQETAELADRYGSLTQVLAEGNYADGGTANAQLAGGRAEFEGRVDAAVTARRISRTEGTRLKSDYAAAVQTETGYLRDGTISQTERADLDSRLDALDARLGDTSYAAATPQTPRTRLDTIQRALASNTLPRAERTQLQIEHEDLSRLEAAYARLNATADDRSYLERRIANLETRARVSGSLATNNR